MSEARIFIPGKPVGKERARRGSGGNWYTPRATREYEEFVAWHCRASRGRFGDAGVQVRIVHHVAEELLRGDLDNYTKALFDGLQKSGVIDNDKQILGYQVQLVVGSQLAPGVELFIQELELDDLVIG